MKFNYQSQYLPCLMLALVSIPLACGACPNGPSIGKVIAIKGLVTANRQSAGKVKLKRGSHLCNKDKVRTDKQSLIHIRLKDGTLNKLSQNSSQTYNYRYNHDHRKDKNQTSLLGGLSYISGKMSSNKVAIHTPTSVIGVRGSSAGIAASSQNTRITVFSGRFLLQDILSELDEYKSLVSGTSAYSLGDGKNRIAATTTNFEDSQTSSISQLIEGDSLQDILQILDDLDHDEKIEFLESPLFIMAGGMSDSMDPSFGMTDRDDSGDKQEGTEDNRQQNGRESETQQYF